MESIKCEYCEKVIEGFSLKQVDYLMAQHKLAKHREEYKKEIGDEKDGGSRNIH